LGTSHKKFVRFIRLRRVDTACLTAASAEVEDCEKGPFMNGNQLTGKGAQYENFTRI